MEQVPLKAQKRTILGRKVKTLRREGIIPAHVFGHKVKTIHVQVPAADFSKVFEKVGETGIIELTIGADKRPVLVRDLQKNPVSDELIHIDFYQVNLSEKVKVNVPVEIIGQSAAVERKLGLLLTPISEIEVEALPMDLPETIDVDITKLENVGEEIKVKDLSIDKSKVEVHTDLEQIVAQIGELVTKEMEAVEAEIEAEQAETAEESVAEGEGEGEVEGEEKKEGEEETTEEKKATEGATGPEGSGKEEEKSGKEGQKDNKNEKQKDQKQST